MQTGKSNQKSINQQLIEAAKVHDLILIKTLVQNGADVNYIHYSNSNGWYSGDTNTPLYAAVHSDFKGNEKNYVDVLQYLLENKADTKFQAIRGNWNHCTAYPLFSQVGYILNKFKSQNEKIRFIQLFVTHGANLNQIERHQRSKNWRAYRTQTCFIFQLMNGCGLQSKLRQLHKNYPIINIQNLKMQKQKQINQQFQKQNPHYSKEQNQQQEGQQDEESEESIEEQNNKNKAPEVSLIKNLINYGVDPNSFSSSYHWQNYQNENYDEEQGQYQQFHKYDQKISQTYENILHRAIMNNSLELVSFLINKGAKIDKKCKFTVEVPLYPNQWPQQLINRKKKQNNKELQSAQKLKQQYEQNIKNSTDEQQIKQFKENLKYQQLRIFKAKRFAIQSQCPIGISQIKQLDCVELAEKLNKSGEIIQLLKNQMLKTKG